MILANVLKPIFGSRNDRLLRKYSKTVKQINALEENIAKLSDDDLKAKALALKTKVQDTKASLDDVLPEAFALTREASKRTLKMRHFDVQLVGGIALHEGKVSEMRTGEGKTLVVTLPAVLNALTGKGVHIVTVNDYLAQRDSDWMRPIFEALGLKVGVILNSMDKKEKQEAYACDVVWGTNNEFGFDYLRDNMAFSEEDRMQRELNFAVVDEADSILIDEARTPLIISGADEQSSDLYTKVDKIIPKLTKREEKDGPGDFYLDEKAKQAYLTEDGHSTIEKLLVDAKLLDEGTNLYDVHNISLMHHVYAALRAHKLFRKDVDYIVKDGQIIIVDEHTGRTMEGRRWSEGLHQAVEAKEKVEINSENQTLASITLQNYFRLYNKLAGMTGTADTEAFELQQIYDLEVVVVPTNKPVAREDKPDLIYMTVQEKYDAIIEDIADCVKNKQPVLVGTISIEASELLSNYLKKKKIPHNVLNAKYHEQEAKIVAEAGRPGAVTIATNMAGRGTDIVLGGNFESELAELKADNDGKDLDEAIISAKRKEWEERHATVIKAGGLRVIGTERHESRRIDNQLRGRSGRQGDPGSSQFYLSVKDNLMRIFVSDKVAALLSRLGMEKGEAITHSWVSKAIENAQRKVEGYNFDVRKQLLEYDNVANEQRKVIYLQRNKLMKAKDISSTITEMRKDVVENIVDEFIPPNSMVEEWDLEGLTNTFEGEFGHKIDIDVWLKENPNIDIISIKTKVLGFLEKVHKDKESLIGDENLRTFEKAVMLNTLDALWKEHLSVMDYMRQSIHLRGYAQKDPKQEYKREAFVLFTNLLESIKRDVISTLSKVEVRENVEAEEIDESLRSEPSKLSFQHSDASSVLSDETSEDSIDEEAKTYMRTEPKVGRNDPCPCGSGKKYKQCHGKVS